MATAGSAGSGSSSAASSSTLKVGSRPNGPPRWLGKRVGRFKLVSLLGKGAYGRVFLAEDEDLNRRVALKILTADATAKSVREGASDAAVIDAAEAARQGVQRMVREARAAARIEHPNAVQVYEVGRLEGTGVGGYIAMELLDGGNLQDLINAVGPMDAARACTLVADAAEALQYGHDAGVVHRDVKPANLMLSRHGRCKVADFGLAYVDDPSDPHKYARAVGTALYMAPEVALGAAADARSDQYSLAASLFTLLAGRPPYVGDRRAVLSAHIEAPLPDLSPVRPDLDPRLGGVIQKAMGKDPAGRFATIRQFGQALRLFTVALDGPASVSSSGVLVPAGASASSWASSASRSGAVETSVTASGSAPLMTPRRRSIWPWIAAAALALAVVGVLFFASRPGEPAERAEAEVAPAPVVAPSPPVALSSDDVNPADVDRLLRIAAGEDPAHADRRATVSGRVADAAASRSGKVFRLHFDDGHAGRGGPRFQVVWFPGDDRFERMSERFGGEAGSGLVGKTISVEGRVETYEDDPQIIVESPDQIRVLSE